MKQLDKNGVAIKLTKKNYKKIYKTLKMFPQERINSADEVLLETGKFPSGMTLTEWIEGLGTAFLWFHGGNWRMDWETEDKLTVKPKQLRNILYAEHCKEGDYVVVRINGVSDYIIKFLKYDKGEIVGSRFIAICDAAVTQNAEGTFTNFIRYATQEEIDLLEGKKEKIAVRVDNEKEFNAIEKYRLSLGFDKSTGKGDMEFPLSMQIEKKWGHTHVSGENTYLKDYKIIPFSDFAKEHGIRVPLLVSEDGIELFDGDEYTCVYHHEGVWYKGNDGLVLKPENNCVDNPQESKAFSTPQAALDWIEAQKPKKVVVSIWGDEDATVYKDKVVFTDPTPYLKLQDVQAIHKAMEELNS